MSIFIILVLCFVYFYCSALEAATDPMESIGSTGGFDDNYYDSNHRRANPDYRVRHYSSRVWDLSKFK